VWAHHRANRAAARETTAEARATAAEDRERAVRAELATVRAELAAERRRREAAETEVVDLQGHADGGLKFTSTGGEGAKAFGIIADVY
jgi:hypothetical protein